MHYIVTDFEYNQPFKINPTNRRLENGVVFGNVSSEIIEIGAVKIDSVTLDIVDTFQSMVRPSLYLEMHPKIYKITKIDMSETKRAMRFKSVIMNFINWIGDDNYIFCTWGSNDINELERNCKYHNISMEWLQNYLDIQRYFGMKKQIGIVSLERAAKYIATETSEQYHRALNDALCASKILNYIGAYEINEYVDRK